MHDVAPGAVTIAVAIDAIICTMNFIIIPTTRWLPWLAWATGILGNLPRERLRIHKLRLLDKLAARDVRLSHLIGQESDWCAISRPTKRNFRNSKT